MVAVPIVAVVVALFALVHDQRLQAAPDVEDDRAQPTQRDVVVEPTLVHEKSDVIERVQTDLYLDATAAAKLFELVGTQRFVAKLEVLLDQQQLRFGPAGPRLHGCDHTVASARRKRPQTQLPAVRRARP